MNRVSKSYYKNIRHHFPLMGHQEKKYLLILSKHLENYEKQYPNACYNDYIEYFGDIDDIVSAFYEHVESEYIIKRMKIRKIIKYTSAFIVLIFIILSLLCMIFIYKEYVSLQDAKGDYYFEEYIIEYD